MREREGVSGYSGVPGEERRMPGKHSGQPVLTVYMGNWVPEVSHRHSKGDHVDQLLLSAKWA